MKAIMIQGTASDVGKSVICTALCRIFYEDGWRVAPFKSQNMALNSYVTKDGKEIGRAQGVQAEAAGTVATSDMNPILLKPKGNGISEVVIHGKHWGDVDFFTYRGAFQVQALAAIRASLERLQKRFDLLVVEGAGSPAEINLNDREIVNMRIARMTQAPVLLLTDIDRGGAFASLVGTLALLEKEDRQRVKGFLINKFRGDYSLLEPGLRWLEEKTGIPVLGVIPYLNHQIEAEDSLNLVRYKGQQEDQEEWNIDVAVVQYPYISNFTDLDPLWHEAGIRVRMIQSLDAWGKPDVVILPGSKNSLEDLKWLKITGLDQAIVRHYEQGGWVVGICGGYQMLGRELLDPWHVEGQEKKLQALGLLDIRTLYQPQKATWRRKAEILTGPFAGERLQGYEIHLGLTRGGPGARPWMEFYADEEEEIGERSAENLAGALSPCGRIMGTYLHHLFHNRSFTRRFFNHIRRMLARAPVAGPVTEEEMRREREYARLAAHVRKHIQIEKIYRLLQEKRDS